MRIIVESLSGAHRFVNKKWYTDSQKFAIITITGSTTDFHYTKNIVDHLRVPVSDIDESMPDAITGSPRMIMFGDDHAEDIKNFVAMWKDKVDFFLIHCDAGVSRSRAVGAALDWVFNGEDLEHFKKGVPNPTIYKKLLKAYGFSNDYEDHVQTEEYPCFMCGRTWALESGLWNASFVPERHWHLECNEDYQEYLKQEKIHGNI